MEIQAGTVIAKDFRVISSLRESKRSFMLSGPNAKRYVLDLYDTEALLKGAAKAYKAGAHSDPLGTAVLSYGSIEQANCFYLIRDFREGVLLSELKKINFHDLVSSFHSIFRTLVAYEGQGLLHGNVQPGSIIVNVTGKQASAALINPFGFEADVAATLFGKGHETEFIPPEEVKTLFLSVFRDIYGAGKTLLRFIERPDVSIDEFDEEKRRGIKTFCDIATYESSKFRFQTMLEMSKAFEGGYAVKHLIAR